MNKKIFLIIIAIILLVIGAFDLYWYLNKSKQVAKENLLFCPVPAKYCHTGKPLVIDNYYLGLGYNIPAGTPIYALTSGLLKDGVMFFAPQVAEGKFPVYSITSKNGITYTYLTTDDKPFSNKDITRGSELFKTSAPIFPKLGSNLVIIANKVSSDGKSHSVQLDPAKFSNE